MSRTHHSNIDVYDHIEGDDLKQAAVIMASFVYNAAMADDKLPRKAVEAAIATTAAATANGSSTSIDR
jgi:hypothetical protein